MIFSLAVFTYIQFTFQFKKRKKIKNGFTTFFLSTFLHSFLLLLLLLYFLFCPEFTFHPSLLFLLLFFFSLCTFLVRFFASDLRNPFKLRNTLPFSSLTFSSLRSPLCILRYLSSSHTPFYALAVHPPSCPFPSLRPSSLAWTLLPATNPICYQPSLISLPLNQCQSIARNFRNFDGFIEIVDCLRCVFY